MPLPPEEQDAQKMLDDLAALAATPESDLPPPISLESLAQPAGDEMAALAALPESELPPPVPLGTMAAQPAAGGQFGGALAPPSATGIGEDTSSLLARIAQAAESVEDLVRGVLEAG